MPQVQHRHVAVEFVGSPADDLPLGGSWKGRCSCGWVSPPLESAGLAQVEAENHRDGGDWRALGSVGGMALDDLETLMCALQGLHGQMAGARPRLAAWAQAQVLAVYDEIATQSELLHEANIAANGGHYLSAVEDLTIEGWGYQMVCACGWETGECILPELAEAAGDAHMKRAAKASEEGA